MPSPAETQDAFARAVLDADMAVPAGVRSPLRARPQRRFAVYRNNVYASLIAVLQGRFPVVARLVGEDFFRAAARVYVERHPPDSPVLMRYGRSFPDFLDDFPPVADTPYLGDVARLERAWSEAYHAADAAPLGPDALAGVAPEEAEALTFRLHPSVRVVRSRFPVVTIWSANSGEEKPEPINAGAGGEDALIARPDLAVEVRRLPEGGAAFIKALASGATLGEAAAHAGEIPGFDLAANLAGLVRSGAIAAPFSSGEAVRDAAAPS